MEDDFLNVRELGLFKYEIHLQEFPKVRSTTANIGGSRAQYKPRGERGTFDLRDQNKARRDSSRRTQRHTGTRKPLLCQNK